MASGKRTTRSRSAALRCYFGLVCQIRREPALRFSDVDPFAPRVVLHLIATDPPDVKVPRRRMCEIQAADRCWRQHGVALGECDPGPLGLQQREQLALLAVIRAGRISERGT